MSGNFCLWHEPKLNKIFHSFFCKYPARCGCWNQLLEEDNELSFKLLARRLVKQNLCFISTQFWVKLRQERRYNRDKICAKLCELNIFKQIQTKLKKLNNKKKSQNRVKNSQSITMRDSLIESNRLKTRQKESMSVNMIPTESVSAIKSHTGSYRVKHSIKKS